MSLFGPSNDDLKELLDVVDGEESGPSSGYIELERLSDPPPQLREHQAKQRRCIQALDVHEVRESLDIPSQNNQSKVTVVFGSVTENWCVVGSYSDLLHRLSLAVRQAKGK